MKKELSYLETIKAIDEVLKYFEKQLEARLSLTKVGCPLFGPRDIFIVFLFPPACFFLLKKYFNIGIDSNVL